MEQTQRHLYIGKTIEEAGRLAAKEMLSVFVCSWDPQSSLLQAARPHCVNVYLDANRRIDRAWTIPTPEPSLWFRRARVSSWSAPSRYSLE